LYKPGFLIIPRMSNAETKSLKHINTTIYYSSIPNGQAHAGVQIRLESRKHDEKFRVMMEVNPFWITTEFLVRFKP